MIRIVPRKETRISDRACEQFSRILAIIEFIAPLRRGATVDEISRDVSDFFGRKYCERTILRDMQALESLGLVEYFRFEDRSRRWVFRDSTVRAAVVRAVASVRMQATLGEYRPIDAAAGNRLTEGVKP